ncbi:MAG: hypothetical protein GY711_07065 [bacterium]|nr:hypothetical protein [bacterium]
MPLFEFLLTLQETGRPLVDAEDEETLGALETSEDALRVLRDLHASASLELAGPALELDERAAVWGARTLRRAARYLVARAFEAEEVVAGLNPDVLERADPRAHWSVDLCLRHLPQLARQAVGAAPDDPLVGALGRLGRAWPLSSVGMQHIEDADPEPLLGCVGLRTLYADRIIARKDWSRLGHPIVDESVRAVVGYHEQLAPGALERLADRMEGEPPDECAT